jgi:predicted nucleotidyltransferase
LKKWEKAVEEFLKEWKLKEAAIGVLICGSYVTGDPSNRSDIDLHIILSDKVDWRERGNKYVNGYLIEYFANPPKQIRKYFQEDFNDHRTMAMVQFITGEIIRDDTGMIKKLKEEAKAWLSKKYEPLHETILEVKKYAIWDSLDNLNDCYEQNRSDFSFVYFNSLNFLFSEYCSVLGLEQIPAYQIGTYLTDPNFKRKYIKETFPDQVFSEIFVKALHIKEENCMTASYEKLANHVLNAMGGFCIDGWKVKSKVEA